MRRYFEEQESARLAPYAVKSATSQGRQFPEPLALNRTCFQRDRDRIIHSKAFRRLKHKTQVFVATESDHFRSRLTHTIEVAQISRHLARLLLLNEDVSEAIALAHDLGHTPFGHAGERTLNELMQPQGGFEHNLQSLRVVDFLEKKYPQFPGLNLSFEIREGLKKHATPWDHPEVDGSHFITLEAQVVNLADEIAYNNHDLDDGLSSRILNELELEKSVSLWREAKKAIKSEYVCLDDAELKYLINSYLISTQVQDVIDTAQRQLQDAAVGTLADLQKIDKPLISFSRAMQDQAKELRKYLFGTLYTHHSVYRMNKKGQMVIRSLFDAFVADQKLLPEDYRKRVSDAYSKERVTCDYIAGMTDTYALREYKTIFE